MLAYITGLFASVVSSSLLTWATRSFARRHGLAKGPHSSRHIHEVPIPRLGGIAIFTTFSVFFLLHSLVQTNQWVTSPLNGDVGKILVIATALFLVGLADDLVGVPALTKLLVEIAGGAVLYLSGIGFEFGSSHVAGSFTWFICFLATIGWVVLICNAINLIDGIDGLAAGAALFSMATIFAVALGTRSGVANATVVLAGSLFGFLLFNFNPASIFMGDSGSLFVGFLLSAFVLSEQPKSAGKIHGILVPLVCFALPLTDVGLSVLRRFLSGHSLFGADREHIHHKLLDLGLSQRQAVGVLYAVSALFSISSLFLLNPSPVALLPVAGIVLLTIFFGVRKLKYHEFLEIVRTPEPSKLKRRRVSNNIAIRKAAAGLQMTRDPKTIAILLETCLSNEFDGFALDLSDDFLHQYRVPQALASHSLAAHWAHSRERLSIKLDLNSNDGLLLGELILFHDACTPLLARMELIRGPLRSSLVGALQNSFPTAWRKPRLLSLGNGHQSATTEEQHLDSRN